jgi:hypothetical protein
MPKFLIKYTETVVQTVVIEEDSKEKAKTRFYEGDYSSPHIHDAYDSEIEEITELD